MTPLDTPPAPPPPPSLPAAPDTSRLSTSLMLGGMAPPGSEGPLGPPPGLSAAPTFASLQHALRRRWLLAVPLALLATVLAVGAVLFFLPPLYVSALRFQIRAHQGPGVVFQAGGEDASEFLLYKAKQQAMVVSPLVL